MQVISAERVTILMGLYRGASYLDTQLQSLLAQEYPHWDLIVGDDGGGDAGVEILARFARRAPRHRVRLRPGPGQGFAANYLRLLADLPAETGPVALADQDDIWLPGKLARAQACLNDARPVLYCSRRWVWGGAGGHERPSRAYGSPGFANALIENVAPGNTIVLNGAAARLARRAARRVEGVYAHDWWLYQLLTGAGARVVIDPIPTLLYRQHGGNALGAGERWRSMMRNKLQVMQGLYARRIGQNLKALMCCRDLLTPEARLQLELFDQARRAPLPTRLALLNRARVYRQGRLSGLGFWGAACLGRI